MSLLASALAPSVLLYSVCNSHQLDAKSCPCSSFFLSPSIMAKSEAEVLRIPGLTGAYFIRPTDTTQKALISFFPKGDFPDYPSHVGTVLVQYATGQREPEYGRLEALKKVTGLLDEHSRLQIIGGNDNGPNSIQLTYFRDREEKAYFVLSNHYFIAVFDEENSDDWVLKAINPVPQFGRKYRLVQQFARPEVYLQVDGISISGLRGHGLETVIDYTLEKESFTSTILKWRGPDHRATNEITAVRIVKSYGKNRLQVLGAGMILELKDEKSGCWERADHEPKLGDTLRSKFSIRDNKVVEEVRCHGTTRSGTKLGGKEKKFRLTM